MKTAAKPTNKYGWCPSCSIYTKHTLGTHRSGERMYQCTNCLHHWTANPRPVPKITRSAPAE